MIKAIFFDAAGILYTRNGPTEEFAIHLLQDNGFSTEISSDLIQKQFSLRSQANQGVINHEIYWEQYLLVRKVTDPELRKKFIEQIINYSNNIQSIPGSRETLAELKRRGFLMGIITDTMYPVEWKMRRLEKAGVAQFIEIVACSTDLGAHKPDPVVYSYALQQANLTPDESAFVGHLGIELEGAQKAGMTTIAINYDVDAKADYYCSSLLDLLNLPILQKSIHESIVK
ncbi:MAG: hypothetical protein CVU39_18565 [Chloroflexi bacterium HGW-Chloroflexi-10]|nr:MAG: hypothetical protein CVU39_18565 [Chloroflexi bacterium HGW-Chloroflexi-10]